MAVKTFTAGSVLTASDTNTYLANAGLVYITSTTVGTAVSSVTVSNCFSSTYDHYKIVYMGGSASTDGDLQMTLGATTAGYYLGVPWTTYGAVAGQAAVNNGASWVYAGSTRPNLNSLNVELFNPNAAVRTAITGTYVGVSAASVTGSIGGYLDNTTAYTAFTLTPSAGTITGGTITVYGYRKA